MPRVIFLEPSGQHMPQGDQPSQHLQMTLPGRLGAVLIALPVQLGHDLIPPSVVVPQIGHEAAGPASLPKTGCWGTNQSNTARPDRPKLKYLDMEVLIIRQNLLNPFFQASGVSDYPDSYK